MKDEPNGQPATDHGPAPTRTFTFTVKETYGLIWSGTVTIPAGVAAELERRGILYPRLKCAADDLRLTAPIDQGFEGREVLHIYEMSMDPAVQDDKVTGGQGDRVRREPDEREI